MKTSLFLFSCLAILGTSAFAGVMVTPTGIAVNGVIEGSGQEPVFRGDTIDYLIFEVTTRGPVRLIGTGLRFSQFLAMGVVVGGGEPFDIPGLPYLLFRETNEINPEFTHLLDPGTYLVQAAVEDDEDSDLYPYFTPVNRSGGGFVSSPYSFTVEGPIAGIDFREGNLDGTFTVTQIVPEPTAAALPAAAAAAIGFARRRRS